MGKLYLVLLICAVQTGYAQYTLSLKNDDTSAFRLVMRQNKLDVRVLPGISKSYPISRLRSSTEYAIYSDHGNFLSEDNGPLLPAGQYILIFMWNKKYRLYRTVLRSKMDND